MDEIIAHIRLGLALVFPSMPPPYIGPDNEKEWPRQQALQLLRLDVQPIARLQSFGIYHPEVDLTAIPVEAAGSFAKAYESACEANKTKPRSDLLMDIEGVLVPTDHRCLNLEEWDSLDQSYFFLLSVLFLK